MTSIEFLSVFEATRGLALLRLQDPHNKQWEYRDHNYGSLNYEITEKQSTMLKDNNVGYMILNGDNIVMGHLPPVITKRLVCMCLICNQKIITIKSQYKLEYEIHCTNTGDKTATYLLKNLCPTCWEKVKPS